MTEIRQGRWTAEIEGDFVVFLIGARINRWWQPIRTVRDLGGIWHETFLVRDGEYEAVYGNMPPRGLGKVGTLVPAAESSRARTRIKRSADAA